MAAKAKPPEPKREVELKPHLWWRAEKKKLSEALTGVASALWEDQKPRRSRLVQNFRLYGNFNARDVAAGSYNRAQAGKKNNRVTFNLIQSSIDTVTAKIAKNHPRPRFLTDGGSHSQQKKAEELDFFTQGIFYQARVRKLSPLIFRDSCIGGTGVVKVDEDPRTCRVRIARVFADELFTDDREALYGNPRAIYHRRTLSKEEILGEWAPEPDEDDSDEVKAESKRIRDIVEKATAVENPDGRVSTAELLQVIEAWHLPSGKVPEFDVDEYRKLWSEGEREAAEKLRMEGHDGRHVAIIPGVGVLSVRAWRKTYFPFPMLHWTEPQRGLWGQGASDQLTGIQFELNKLLRMVQLSSDFCIPKLYVDRGSKTPQAFLDNLIGAIVPYGPGGNPPRMETWNGISPQIIEHIDRLIRQGYEIIGVSLMSAAGRKPSGLESGAALREFHDIETERFVMAGRAYEEFHCDLARQVIDVAADICQRDGSYKVNSPDGRKKTREIDFADIDLDADSFVMQVFPTSSLPTTPAGRLAQGSELHDRQLIDNEEFIRILDFPDLERVNELAEASSEFIHFQIEEMVSNGVSKQPHPYCNLAYAKKTAIASLLRAEMKSDVPESNRQLLRNYIATIDVLIQKAAPPAPMVPPGPAPVAPGAPAGGPPPGPPGMAPPAGVPLPAPAPVVA